LGKGKIKDIVAQMTGPIAEANGLELVEVEYKKEGGQWYLRVYLDKEGGVDLADCEKVSVQLSEKLDEEDPIPQAYILEVSSPGLERPLKKIEDYQRFKGHKVNIKTFAPVGGRKKFKGKLGEVVSDGVVVYIDDEEFIIPLEKIASARLVAEFNW